VVQDRILHEIHDFFLGSLDFNGILLSDLRENVGIPWDEVRRDLAHLVEGAKITLVFASHSINPHIKRVPDLPVSDQLARLWAQDPATICAYPTAEVIRGKADLSAYDARPFTRRLALAEPQLIPVFFDLDVLERYFRDPRYHFDFHDLAGSIGMKGEHAESPDVPGRDKVFLQSFGIGYDAARNRVVVAFLRYLSDLSPEHQQIWNAHLVAGPCSMNSDYARITIFGEWREHYSAYEAFLHEQAQLNKLAGLIGKPALFRETFEDNRPAGFAPMLRPTRSYFEEFVHVLDKMLSENLNRDFFRGDVPVERKVPRDDGSVEVERPGTLQLLEQWLSTKYRSAAGDDVSSQVVRPLKDVRKRRQHRAHALRVDEYDRSLPSQQDQILGKACRALTALRLILWSHPHARNRYSPPEWLDGDKIVFY
jgi:hypothetical protein